MRSHAKASTAGSTQGQASGLGRFFRGDDATLGALSGKGRGAPSKRLCLALFATAVAVLFLVQAAGASASVLSISLSGGGTGTVTSSPPGIECSNTPGHEKLSETDCSFEFPLFQFVTFTASPDEHSFFKAWTANVGIGSCDSSSEKSCETLSFFEPATINASFLPPPSPPVATTQAATDVQANQATMQGAVNPNTEDFPLEECFFEYGLTTAYGKVAACQPSEIGPGTSDVPVTGHVAVLTGSTTYHYRLVTSNVGGFARGADRTFTTQGSAADSCPNAAFRKQQGSGFLPECRAYEMVSPPYKQSQAAFFNEPTALSPNGEAAGWASLGLFADAQSSNNGSGYTSARTSSGWKTSSINAPFSVIGFSLGAMTLPSRDFANAVGCGRIAQSTTIGAGDWSRPVVCARKDANGSWQAMPSFTAYNKYENASSTRLERVGTSFDASHLVLLDEQGVRFLPNDTATDQTPSLYEVAGLGGPNPELRLVNVDSDEKVIGPSSAPAIGGPTRNYRAVSADGSTIYFTTTPAGGVPTLYARLNGSSTAAISNPVPAECTTCDSTAEPGAFMGASEDGSKAFFMTSQQLVNADTDSTPDLYEYDLNAPAGQHIFQVSGGGAGDLSLGSGADVQGVVQTSDDGSTAYFVSSAVLTTIPNALGQTATPGDANLYGVERNAEYPSGHTTFVASVPAGEVNDLTGAHSESQVTPDGRYLVFATDAQLISSGPEADTDSAADIYRYDSHTGELVRVSIGRPGFPASGNGNTEGMTAVLEGPDRGVWGARATSEGQAISDDGSYVVFDTPERLQADDVNPGVTTARCEVNTPEAGSRGCDVYLWHDRGVSLISDGNRAGGTQQGVSIGRLSASGSEVVFNTSSQVLPEDTDEQNDIYVARIDGGFPYTPPPPNCESNDTCHGAPAAAPAAGQASSATFSGPGNEAAPAKHRKKPHKKHRKRRGGKKQVHKKHTTTRSHG